VEEQNHKLPDDQQHQGKYVSLHLQLPTKRANPSSNQRTTVQTNRNSKLGPTRVSVKCNSKQCSCTCTILTPADDVGAKSPTQYSTYCRTHSTDYRTAQDFQASDSFKRKQNVYHLRGLSAKCTIRSRIEAVDELPILGLTFDRRMTWKPHPRDLKDKCKGRLKMMETLAAKSW
jgi:hypothetical protein